MKKQFIQLGVVMVLLIVFVGGYFGISKYVSKQEKKEKNPTVIAFELKDIKDISALSYTNSGKAISFGKKDSKWYYIDDRSVKIKSSEIESMLKQLICVEANQKIEKPENLTEYGFEKDDKGGIIASTNSIVVIDGNKKTYTIYIGNQNPYESTRYYMMVAGDDNVYVVDSNFVDTFSKTVDDVTEEETTSETVTEDSETQE